MNNANLCKYTTPTLTIHFTNDGDRILSVTITIIYGSKNIDGIYVTKPEIETIISMNQSVPPIKTIHDSSKSMLTFICIVV